MSLPVSAVEEYAKLKGWDYRIDGNQLVAEQCPFCLSTDYKFFINTNNFLWDCKKGKCLRNGNERQLKSALGDKIEKTTTYKETGIVEREAIPDVEKAHEFLMDTQIILDQLVDQRGWDIETIVKMKIGFLNRFIREQNREIPCLVYPYFTGKKCNFVKWRTIPGAPKGFSALSGWDVPLFNANVVEKDMEYLILVEGEADTLSVLSAGEPNVAGVPGAGLKKVTWDKLLDLPKKLFLLFDNDEAGQKGAKEFAERFGVEKFHNILVPEIDLLDPVDEDGDIRTKVKDIGEYLMAVEGDKLEALRELMRESSVFDVDGVCSIEQGLDLLSKSMEERGNNLPKYDTPWESVNMRMGGAEDRHLVVLQAPKKTGKTTLALNWSDYLVAQKEVSVYFECLEMDAEQLSRKWASYILGINDSPGISEMSPEVLIEAKRIAREDREHYLLFGSANYSKLDEVFVRWKTIIRRYGVKVIVFDNLQLLTDLLYTPGMGNRTAFMSKLTKKFKAFAMEMNILFILIAQAKRLRDDNDVADADTLEGSSSAGNDCDTMMIMNRTKNMAVKADDLKKLGDVQTNSTLNPELYIEIGLSRFASGGLATLMIDGATSYIDEIHEDRKRWSVPTRRSINGIKLVKAAHAEGRTKDQLGGMKFTPAPVVEPEVQGEI